MNFTLKFKSYYPLGQPEFLDLSTVCVSPCAWKVQRTCDVIIQDGRRTSADAVAAAEENLAASGVRARRWVMLLSNGQAEV